MDDLNQIPDVDYWLNIAALEEAAGEPLAALGALQLALSAEFFASHPDAQF